jgi:uncharacterized protein (DUF2252 family)
MSTTKAPPRRTVETTRAAAKAFEGEEEKIAGAGTRVDSSLEGRVTHVSSAKSAAKGRDCRRAVPRSVHGAWEPPPNRLSPVEIISAQAESREPDLVPIRHGRMMVSPFTFYRGAAAVMAADLAATPTSGLRVQLCGDAHLLNFGGYASPERDLVFDVNDFDETLPGPWEWDMKRLGASIEVAARDSGLPRADRRSAVEAAASQYREAMTDFAGRTELGVWYARLDADDILALARKELGRQSAPVLMNAMSKARAKDSMKAFSKLTQIVEGEPRILADPPLIVPLRDLVESDVRPHYQAELTKLFHDYRRTLQPDRRHLLEQYRMVDLARKVVGVGSVGTRCWILLLLGRKDADPVFLQIKEAQDSVVAPYAGRSKVSNQGQRVVEGQRVMQASSDIFLGWIRGTGLDDQTRDFYVRQLWDWKVSVDPANLTSANLAVYGRICAWTLARAHARSGDRFAIASYLGTGPSFDRAIGDFAVAYADQNERDYETFVEAINSGELPVRKGL